MAPGYGPAGRNRPVFMAQMKHTIAAAGLTMGDSSYLFPSLVIPKMIVRAIEAVRGHSPAVPEIPPAPVNRTVQLVLRAEHTYAPWVPFGTSLMAVATRGVR